MSEKCRIAYGSRVTVLPGAASKKIINGASTLADIRVLVALCDMAETDGENVVSALAEVTGLVESKVENALAFWRGCGVIELTESDDGEATENSSVQPQKVGITPKPKLSGKDIPSYSGSQISELLDRDGGKMKHMVDACQQLLGRMLNSVETASLVGMCDWLGLDSEYIVTMTAYYTKKKPGCNIRYLEKAATDLVNNGITTLEELDVYLKEMELYDGIAGKLRSWLGIGGRAYTQKENGMIKRWVKDFAYNDELIHYAYEITVNSKGEFNFDYANKILENWFRDGVKTKSEAEAKVSAFRQEKENAPKDGGSFDTDEFFSLALKRSYSGMKNEEN